MKPNCVGLIGILACVLSISSGEAGEQPILKLNNDDESGFLAFVDDGTRLLSVGYNNSWARVWELSSGTVERSFKAHWPAPFCALAPDRKTLATLGLGRVSLYDLNKTEHLRWIPECGAMDFTPDGKLLAIGDSKQQHIVLWEIQSGKAKLTLKGADKPASIAFSPCGKLLAASTYDGDGAVHLWNVTSGKRFANMEGHPDAKWDLPVAFSPDGKTLASGGIRLSKPIRPKDFGFPETVGGTLTVREILGGEIKLWDPTTGKLGKTLYAHATGVKELRFTNSGKFFITGSDDVVVVWNTATWDQVITIKCEEKLRSIAVSPDGKQLALGCMNKVVTIWSLTE
jgi:WD40 repeat protein